ncbi:hypothetical protein GUITHDRAFT_152554 [Guillardia theta CCMP2712]|uniref:Uncharacterized protein n=1 Tax=Guillardia theta (strain CCMP2712) TaxID=905079 RepID=L1JCD5_GUITC|nr:hypothetical protein GUITHDRAFT_152554 [Guillardia theta CCMP2712]EKX45750.1 hypothetical protein GUITHDRAFT_152554 [Guillardia theta CCMP2712]|eukprot:XP_005832730.1 hypothetical protein GUITHDRAFT_152554 [Guillardia theta CCMP2712]
MFELMWEKRTCAVVPEVMHGDMSLRTASIGTPHCNSATGVCTCLPASGSFAKGQGKKNPASK